MNRIIRKKNKYYTTICNACVRDKNLSLKAKGLMTMIMSLPDDWDFSVAGIAAITKEGKNTIYTIINELKDNGYCIAKQIRNEKGIIEGYDYVFIDNPKDNNPYPKNPDMDNPDTGFWDEINKEEIKKEGKDKNSKKRENAEFVERIYAMYPTKCPMRGMSLGKCSKDKERIAKLLKLYTEEEIERVVKHEVEEKYGKSWMQNFSTFLNNFPDPKSLDGTISTIAYPKSLEDVKDDDICSRRDFFLYRSEKNGIDKLLEQMGGGFPETEAQFQNMLRHTKGGARTLAYVALVFVRDGYKEYYDDKGFMWIYLNYIKANGLYQE